MKVTYIPDEMDLGVEREEDFDPVYINALFEFGHEKSLERSAFRSFEEIIKDQ